MSGFKAFIGKVHLVLGFVSGLVVFIVAITGCMYAFQAEIQDLTQSYRFVENNGASALFPSEIKKISGGVMPGKQLHSVLYQGPDRSAKAIYYSEADEYYYLVYVNQYTGEVLKVKDELTGFFRFILDGHFYLWLPHEIGQPVVATATLIFVIMLITGLILWWPKRRTERRQKLTIKWNARWRRRNYDLHSVAGFYVFTIALVLALTGLIWGFEWFANGVYKVASGGEELRPYSEPFSELKENVRITASAADRVYLKMLKEAPDAQSLEIHFPETDSSSVLAAVNPDADTYYKMDYRYFDQYTLKEMSVDHMWGRAEDDTGARKLLRMNYDIHTGAVLGVAGKVMMFCASLICASLPITGFVMWYGRRYGKKRAKENVVLRPEPMSI